MSSVESTGLAPAAASAVAPGPAAPSTAVELDQRVQRVAAQNLPVAQAAVAAVDWRELGDGGNEELVPMYAQVITIDVEDDTVPTVARVDGSAADVPEANTTLSQEFVQRLTARDPHFQEGRATDRQIAGDRVKFPAHLEKAERLRQDRYELIKFILKNAKSDEHAKQLLTDFGYSYDTVAAVRSLGDPVIYRVRAIPRRVFQGRVFNERDLEKARATRQLAKAVQPKEEIRKRLVVKAKIQHANIAHQIG